MEEVTVAVAMAKEVTAAVAVAASVGKTAADWVEDGGAAAVGAAGAADEGKAAQWVEQEVAVSTGLARGAVASLVRVAAPEVGAAMGAIRVGKETEVAAERAALMAAAALVAVRGATARGVARRVKVAAAKAASSAAAKAVGEGRRARVALVAARTLHSRGMMRRSTCCSKIASGQSTNLGTWAEGWAVPAEGKAAMAAAAPSGAGGTMEVARLVVTVTAAVPMEAAAMEAAATAAVMKAMGMVGAVTEVGALVVV